MSGRDLTKRQKSILYAIVKVYCDTNQSIGSNELKEKFNFSFSSATIRNEYSALRDSGYIYQPFKNAGSIPTEKALKVFITILLDSLEFSSQQQNVLHTKVLELQSKQSELSREIATFLADQVGGAAFALTNNHNSVKGASNLVKHPHTESITDVLDFLENIDQYRQQLMLTSESSGMNMVVGGDNPVLPLGRGYALVATKVTLENGEESVIGVISPLSFLAKKKNLALLSALNSAFQPKAKEDKNKK